MITRELVVITIFILCGIFFSAFSLFYLKKLHRGLMDEIMELDILHREGKTHILHKIEILDKTLQRLIERDMENQIEKRLLNSSLALGQKPKRGRPKKEDSS